MRRMIPPLLLRLQILYLVLASSFNIVSLMRVRMGLTPFTSSNPLAGLGLLSIVALLVLLGSWRYPRLAAVLLIPLIYRMAGTVGRHFGDAGDPAIVAHHAGTWSLAMAGSLNLFGSIVFSIGIVLALLGPFFRQDGDRRP